jgi:hypothetical protein
VFAPCTSGVDGFWGPLAGGASLARPVPLQRWDVDAIYSPEVREAGCRDCFLYTSTPTVSPGCHAAMLLQQRCYDHTTATCVRAVVWDQSLRCRGTGCIDSLKLCRCHSRDRGLSCFNNLLS